MDISKEYIEMCEKAVEIQKNHEWEFGDYWYNGAIIYRGAPLYAQTLEQVTWLPTQSQLQRMLDGKCSYFLLMEFTNFVDTAWGYEMAVIEEWSMEQLWLAFVMNEKYDKIWDNKSKVWKGEQ